MPGDRGPCFLHAARERGLLGELTGLQVASLRFALCGAGQIATRSPAMPVAGPLKAGVQRSARSGCAAAKSAISDSTAAPFAALGVTSAAEPPLLVGFGPLRCNRCARRAGTSAATLRRPREVAARAPVVPPRSPQLRPRQE